MRTEDRGSGCHAPPRVNFPQLPRSSVVGRTLPTLMSRPQSWLIVGAGPSGLATARALREAGVPFDVAERHRDVGGIWDLENPGTPMYETAHFISSKTQSAFDGFPMPESYPDSPPQRLILEYVRAFADAHDLRRRIELNADVSEAAPATSGGWD